MKTGFVNFQPVNTCLAVGFRIDAPEIIRAKKYLANKYGSKYDFAPHITLLLVPYREDAFYKVLPDFEKYFVNLRPFKVKLDSLLLTPKRRFFSIEIGSEYVKPIHKDLFKIASKYRAKEIREKDLKRIGEGFYNKEEVANLEKYGIAHSGDLFQCHLSIGDVVPENVDLKKVEEVLLAILNPIIGTQVSVNEISLILHTDAPKQSEMVELWRKNYQLKEKS
jgi:2'-5' RNA ligase